jgi:hypothetical protein
MITDVHVIRIKSDYSITLDTVENGIISTKIVSPVDIEKSMRIWFLPR